MGIHDNCPACDINLTLTSSKFLNCLHAYCSHCLRKMENRLRFLSGQNNRSGSLNRRSSSSGNAQLGNILCPKCHTLTLLTVRYGIDKLIPSNFAYQPLSQNTLPINENILKIINQIITNIEIKIRSTQKLKIETGIRKSRFLTRIQESREYLDRFVIKANGSFDLKKLSMLKQLQKIRLRVINSLLSKITLLEQLEIDFKYLLDLGVLLKDRMMGQEETVHRLDHRRSAAPVLYHKRTDNEMEINVKKSNPENRFSLIHNSSSRSEEEPTSEDILSGSILPSFTKRFEHLINILDNTLNSFDEDPITSESLTENLRIVYLPEDYTLFEKVLCELPILIVDGNNIPIVNSQHLQDITVQFVYGNQSHLRVELEESEGLFKLRFVPPSSCWGQIIMKYVRVKRNLMITPTRIEIKPLMLDIKHNKKLKTLVI
uniref:RING-type domain-containing protein n=1 Tax=Lepeophtheirus salmonis TaxID=72036 RepID=A0A0K2THA0_LEPSM